VRIEIHSVWSILSEISQTGYVIIKSGRRIVHVFSNMQNVAILRCCFVTFCKQRLSLHSFPLSIMFAQLNFRKPNKQPNEHKTSESPAEQTDGWECRKHLCSETKSKFIKWRFHHFVLGSFDKAASAVHASPDYWVAFSEELGTMSKNNLRPITLVRGIYEGFTLLPL